jgi:hypothetical protein
LRVLNAIAHYSSLRRNLRLNLINGKPKKAVKHLLIAYLKKMAIIHDEQCHTVEPKKTGDSGVNTGKKAATLAAAVLDSTLEEAHVAVTAIWCLTVT